MTENVGPGILAPGDTLQYTFAAPATIDQPDNYTIKAWTALPMDAANGNDTAT